MHARLALDLRTVGGEVSGSTLPSDIANSAHEYPGADIDQGIREVIVVIVQVGVVLS